MAHENSSREAEREWVERQIDWYESLYGILLPREDRVKAKRLFEVIAEMTFAPNKVGRLEDHAAAYTQENIIKRETYRRTS